MKNRNTRKRARNFLGTALAFVLALSLVAGVLPVIDPAYAGSEFQSASPFSKTGYSTYYHNGRFANNLIVNGVDISDWQSKNATLRRQRRPEWITRS